MTFISYAQNFEDVMLWRAFKHIKQGFYVDVGAQHPVIDSVSKAFYERGWRGIHIEPVPEYAELLRKDRPDETILQVALADADGTLDLNLIPDTGLSTAVDAYAQLHQEVRGFDHQRIQVPVLTLNSALKSLVGKDVHWLKIDVEGFEEKVLKGWDSQTLRPWVMVVEATIPNSPEADYASWDPILTATDYQFVYFDGLNRFYVAKEHADLAEAFSCPPNVFDNVQLGLASSGLCRGVRASYEARDKELSTLMEKLAAELNVANEHNTQLQNEWDAAKQRVEALSQRTGRLEGELDAERQRTVQLGAELQAAQEHKSRLQAHAEWLQNEWDAAKQRVEALSQRTGRLEGELDAERQRTVQLGAELQAARENESHLQAHADQFNRELQDIYSSKSWRITAPLRQAMLAAKWMVALPKRAVRWTLRVLKRMDKPLVLWVMRQTLAKPSLKARALSLLNKRPQIKQRLREFAKRSGLIAGWDTASSISQHAAPSASAKNAVEAVPLLIMQTELPKNLSPRAARIYVDLQKAIEVRKP